MPPQIITTEAGEELVVLSRRDYDALMARLGDEAAEARAAARIVAEGRHAIDAGREASLPDWLGEAIARGQTALKSARKRAGLSQIELAVAAGITQGYLSDIERGAKVGADDVLRRIANALQVEPEWLKDGD